MRYVAIAGTWGQRDPLGPPDPWRDWWHPLSHWAANLRAVGWTPYRQDPYVWSTDLDGTWLQRVAQRRRWGDWLAAAYALVYYLGQQPISDAPPEDPPTLIAHSHGGTVALIAIGVLRAHIAGLITVCTPVRQDVLSTCGTALPARWLHLYSDHADRWQWLGEWGDGMLRIAREMPPPARNLPAAKGHGHSGLLTTPAGLRAWPEILHAYEASP